MEQFWAGHGPSPQGTIFIPSNLSSCPKSGATPRRTSASDPRRFDSDLFFSTHPTRNQGVNRLLLSVGLFAASWAPLPAAEFQLNGHKFTLPDGFTIEAVTDSSLVPRPVAACFDPQGRLYVTDSAGLNEKPAEQLKHPQNRLLRLEDTDGDGRFDKSTVFADQVMFPQGCLWHGGSVYVAGPPSIWKFTDTNGDGVADQRTE